jgi:hypothetical protein
MVLFKLNTEKASIVHEVFLNQQIANDPPLGTISKFTVKSYVPLENGAFDRTVFFHHQNRRQIILLILFFTQAFLKLIEQ